VFCLTLVPLRSRCIICDAMEALDPADEWRHLSEHYRQMSDEELLILAQQRSELTDAAQQVLTHEISYRKLKLPPPEVPAPPNPEPSNDSRYDDSPHDEDRELVELRTVWSLSDALQLQTLLDRAGIPFFMGPEKATVVDAVTSDFVNGVSVQVMRIGLPWTRQPMQNYTPADAPGPKLDEELPDLPVRCPKCHSTEVVFGSLASEPTAKDNASSKFEWTCDSCGHEWQDDGIVKEE
jgi:DNA-directed RNA polymerase subunit M/transcription elongation factor TFIIS